MATTEELKMVVDRHVVTALQNENPKDDKKRLESVNEILREETFVNPKYCLFLDDHAFFLRAYIEGTEAWFWIRDFEHAGDGEYLIFETVTLESTDEAKTRFNRILDYFMDKGELA